MGRALAWVMSKGALPLLAFGQFTPEYFCQDETMNARNVIHLGKNTPAGGVRSHCRCGGGA
jgi:hypothetical protein